MMTSQAVLPGTLPDSRQDKQGESWIYLKLCHGYGSVFLVDLHQGILAPRRGPCVTTDAFELLPLS